ncbi:MAG TPA: phage tail protein, partial [Pyrinomonadaceae bacterium]|nr:phage tail protein [Pyrinomonadaceae bacterium]
NGVTQKASTLLQHLPGIYQEDEFLGQYLLAFESLLLRPPAGVEIPPASGHEKDEAQRGLEEMIAGIAAYFSPLEVEDEDFLPWLAGWVALSLRADLDVLRQRDFISRAVWLYRLRGTKQGLEEAVRIYTRLGPTIDEQMAGFQVGKTSTIGEDTRLSSGASHFFRVRILLPTSNPEELSKQSQVVRDILDMEKPAHTNYVLEVDTPSLQIAKQSTVGVDTLVGIAKI